MALFFAIIFGCCVIFFGLLILKDEIKGQFILNRENDRNNTDKICKAIQNLTDKTEGI